MGDLTTLVPKRDLIAFHRCVVGEAANGSAPDYSGNARTLVQGSSPPVITPNILNGRAGWYFDGTKNPLAWSGSVTPKHVFVLAAAEESTFTQYRGLLSGLAAGNWLTANNSGTTFFTFGSEYDYLSDDVAYADFDWQAPRGLVPAIIEVTHPGGIAMDGIQIGQQLIDATRKWKGYYFADLLFAEIQTGINRFAVFEYFAMEWLKWRKVASGLDVWPFQPNWSQPVSVDKTVLASNAVSGAYKGRTKTTAKRGVQLSFENRWEEEADAARAFWDTKYPGTSFIYRDDGYTPPRDTEVRFASAFAYKQDGYLDSTYGFQLVQV